MKSKFYKIYVDGKLKAGCESQFALMNNVIRLQEKYGKERVEVIECEENIPFTKEELEELKKVMKGI